MRCQNNSSNLQQSTCISQLCSYFLIGTNQNIAQYWGIWSPNRALWFLWTCISIIVHCSMFFKSHYFKGLHIAWFVSSLCYHMSFDSFLMCICTHHHDIIIERITYWLRYPRAVVHDHWFLPNLCAWFRPTSEWIQLQQQVINHKRQLQIHLLKNNQLTRQMQSILISTYTRWSWHHHLTQPFVHLVVGGFS